MDRKLLGVLLRSGPARKFDIGYFTRNQDAVTEEERGTLFDDRILNGALLFKYSMFNMHHGEVPDKPVKSLVYVPYDSESPGMGGESFIFSEKNYREFYACKTEQKDARSKPSDRDLEILDVLDSVPTFSPLILEMAFERAGIDVPGAYLDLTESMRRKLRMLMKSRIRPLIVAAFGDHPRRVEHAVEELATKLFSLHDATEILPFVTALQLPPEDSVELMTSWVGITYFEHEYAAAQADLLGVAEFLNSNPHRRGGLNRVNREEILIHVEYIRNRMKEDWAKIRRLSNEYKHAYEGLIFSGDVRTFRDFLLRCKNSYWELGDLLGRFEQIAIAWKSFNVVKQDEIPLGVLLDFLLLMRGLTSTVSIEDVTGRVGKAQSAGFESLSANLF